MVNKYQLQAIARLIDKNTNRVLGFRFVDANKKIIDISDTLLCNANNSKYTDIFFSKGRFFSKTDKLVSDLPKEYVSTSPPKILWIEDGKAGLRFWKWINKELNLGFKIEAPSADGINHGNGQVLNALKHLTDTKNQYYILLDLPYNDFNTQALYGKMINIINEKGLKNVLIIENYAGFESIFISFSKLNCWVKNHKISANDKCIIEMVRNHLNTFYTSELEDSVIKQYKKEHPIGKYGTLERLCSQIMKNLTTDMDYFQITKDDFGECWYCDCCNFANNCGLNLTSVEKANALYGLSYLKDIFAKVVK